MKAKIIFFIVAIMTIMSSNQTFGQYKYKMTDSEKIAEKLEKDIQYASKLMEARLHFEWTEEVKKKKSCAGDWGKQIKYIKTDHVYHKNYHEYTALQVEGGVIEIISNTMVVNFFVFRAETKYYLNNCLINMRITINSRDGAKKEYSITKDSYKSEKARINVSSENLSDLEKEVLAKSRREWESNKSNCDDFLAQLNDVRTGRPVYRYKKKSLFCKVYVKANFILKSTTRPMLEKVMRDEIERARKEAEKEKYSDIIN